MAVYSKSELTRAKVCLEVMRSDIQDAADLSNTIKTFCDQSVSKLKGDSWDLIRGNLNDYIDILALRKTVANELISAIESANNNMLLALGDYSEIDTGHLEEQQALYNQCKSSIDSLNKSTNNTDNDLQYYQNMLNEVSKMINQINEVKRVEQS